VRSDLLTRREAAEYLGVSVSTLGRLTTVAVRRSVKGTGFDYWLGPQSPATPFEDAARLEVSGTLDGTRSEVDARTRDKSRQVQRSAHLGLPAVIAIIDFRQPEARLDRLVP